MAVRGVAQGAGRGRQGLSGTQGPTAERSGADLNAWCDYPDVDLPSGDGPLSGTTLAVKDIFPVAGLPNGWGSPTRLAEAEPDESTQALVQTLLDAGARFAGKAQCEELCFSLTGINAHYGAPVNPRAPDRVTGGSSSGSVSLVAAGAVDIATGTDTGGSIRAPASYTGLVGLRPTHGVVSLDGVMPLAHTFDVAGWFTREADLYATVADLVLPDSPHRLTRLVRLEVLDDLVMDEARETLTSGRARVAERFGEARASRDFHRSIDDWYWAFRECQAFEAWLNLGPWIERTGAELGPGVRERFDFGRGVSRERYDTRTVERHAMIAWMEDLLGDDGCLVLPTMPSCAPLKEGGHESLEAFRERALRLLCVSGLTGLPQITLPLGEVPTENAAAPFGVSLLGPRGSDRALVELAGRVMGAG